MQALVHQLNRSLNAVWAHGGEANKLVLDAPADEYDVRRVEAHLGVDLPADFRAVLRDFAGRLDYWWTLPADFRLPEPLKNIFSGHLHWDLQRLAELEARRRDAAEVVFHDLSNPAHRLWRDKLVFQDVANGDLLALDLSAETPGRVVFLSAGLGPGHGVTLGRNFIDFLDNFVPLACPGAEDVQWLPFLADRARGLSADCPAAQLWLKLLYGA